MATGVGRGEIQMTPSKPRPENRGTAHNYLSRAPNYSQFCPKICCHGNEGRQGKNLNDIVGKPGPENKGISANSEQLSFTVTELYRFEISIGCNAKLCNF